MSGGATRPSAAIDHLVLACATLESGIAWAERTLGVRPAIGGRHAQWGTHNALLSLGEGCYLELLAPDPAAPEPRAGVVPFGLGAVGVWDVAAGVTEAAPRLTAWMVRVPMGGLESACDAMRASGVDCGAIREGARTRPDGSELRWRLTVPPQPLLGGAAPWLIEWSGAEHPSRTAPVGCRLSWLEVMHPEPTRVRTALDAIGMPQVRVKQARAAGIAAGVACPRGVVVI